MTEEVLDLLKKAQESVQAAKLLLEGGFVDFAAGRAYYAMFYAAEAVLLDKDLSYSKHSAVISAFGKEFVKTGCFDSRFHRALIDSFDMRNVGDYGTTDAVSKDEVQEAIQNAEDFLRAVSDFLERRNSIKGFTLIELAIVLVIVGLLVGVGAGMMGMLTSAIKVREAKDLLDGTKQSIISYAAANNRLPDAAGFPTTAVSPQDSWGRPFVFLYYSSLARNNPTKDTICGRRTTPLTLQDNNTGSSVTNVAFVILSRGNDPSTASPYTVLKPGPVEIVSSAALPNPANLKQIEVPDNTDDIVRWVTLDELRSKVGCQGAQLKIVNNELPYGYNNTAYSAAIYADGGVPFTSGGKYSWCIQTSLGDVPTPTNITFKNTGGTNVPFKASCSAGVAVQSDYLIIGGTPVIPAVSGSDGKVYICSQGHISSVTTQPITGAGYTQYWQLAPLGVTGTAWVTGTAYYPAPSNSITVYAYDSAGTSQYKSFVLTINPQQ